MTVTRWQEYFAKTGSRYSSPLEYAVDHWSYNLPLYHRMRALVPPPARVLDVGCGLGFSDIYLQACGYQVTGIDYDQGVVEQARTNAEFLQSGAAFEHGDALQLSRWHGAFDLAYSVGVVEHFDRPVTVRLLAEQARCAPYVACLIPTRFIEHSAGRSDERLYSIGQLARLVAEAGMDPVASFGYGDIPTPLHAWAKRLLPHGVHRLLQDRFSYAMGIVCIGRRKD